MTQKAITIKDLAEKLNISVSTVSRALKDNPEISQQTRKTVQALAKELGYKPNPIAVALKTHKSNTIGVVVPQIVNTFFATVVKKIEDVADKYGYNVLVASSNETFEKEKKNIDIFLANRCDGIILSISKATTSYEHIKQIQDMACLWYYSIGLRKNWMSLKSLPTMPMLLSKSYNISSMAEPEESPC